MAREFPRGTFDDPRFTTYSDLELLGRAGKIEEVEDFWATAKGVDEPIKRGGPVSVPKEHLIRFVTDYCDGHIFTSADLRAGQESMISMVFLPVALGMFVDWSGEALKRVGILYEYHSKALPRSVNGYPIFGSAYILNVDDWQRAKKAISRELGLRNGTRRRVEEDLDADSDVDAEAGGEHVRAAAKRGGADPGKGRNGDR